MTLSMEMFGNLEDASENRMVARVLGYRVGTCDGWFHCGGHCVFMPEFQAEAGLLIFVPVGIDIPKHTGLLVDYYAGQIALVPHASRADPNQQFAAEPIWTGTLCCIEKAKP